MKTIMTACVLAAFAVSGICVASDDGAVVSEPLAISAPGEACPSIPLAEPEVCKAATSVPGKRQVVVEETYTEDVTHTAYAMEEHTRMAKRKIRVATTKTVNQVHARKVRPASGRAPRYTRTIVRVEKPATKLETEIYEETYMVQVPVTYTEPVEKTRKVVRWVDDE